MKFFDVLLLTLQILFSLGCIGYAAYETYYGMASTKWPTTKAHVIEASVEHVSDKYGKKRDKPVVNYRYSVNGRTYTCNRIQFGGTLAPPHGNHTIEEFKDSDVDIFYNPDQPEMACFLSGANYTSAGIMVLIGILCMAPRRSSYGSRDALRKPK